MTCEERAWGYEGPAFLHVRNVRAVIRVCNTVGETGECNKRLVHQCMLDK